MPCPLTSGLPGCNAHVRMERCAAAATERSFDSPCAGSSSAGKRVSPSAENEPPVWTAVRKRKDSSGNWLMHVRLLHLIFPEGSKL
jgi:hypothetical protein